MTAFRLELPNLYNVDWLRSLGAKPAWFGLGFIQLKINGQERLHFWHPELTADVPEEELHDHRYDFRSRILVGSLTHEEWIFLPTDVGNYDMVEVDCKPAGERSDKPVGRERVGRGKIVRGNRYTMVEGSEYSFGMHGFHRIRAERAVTHLSRGPVEKDTARVLRPRGTKSVCPFAKEIPEERLWEYIADLLEDRLSGYHINAIPKGSVGNASKVVEEALEFLDAVQQKSRIMALVELSDLYGSMKSYLKENHPEISSDELAVMAGITERAFRNGRR